MHWQRSGRIGRGAWTQREGEEGEKTLLSGRRGGSLGMGGKTLLLNLPQGSTSFPRPVKLEPGPPPPPGCSTLYQLSTHLNGPGVGLSSLSIKDKEG